MKRMTPATRLLRDRLVGKYLHFSKQNMLADDGSFYCLDKYLMEQLGIGDNTIRRARIYLKETGEINYAIGKHKGAPTRYWILSKGAKMAPKEANLVMKASQFGSLNNKALIKIENKNMPDIPSSFTEEDKEGIRAFVRLYGIPRARIFWVDKGYNPESIKQILEGMASCKE